MKLKITLIAENDKPISGEIKWAAQTEADRIVSALQVALDGLWTMYYAMDDSIAKDKLTVVDVELMDEVSE